MHQILKNNIINNSKHTIMKTKFVYELCFQTEDNEWHNLLYSSLKEANKDLEEEYKIGERSYGKNIINSFVIQRVLF